MWRAYKNPPARFGQRRSLTARFRRRCSTATMRKRQPPTFCTGAAGRRPCADPARHLASWRRDEGVHRRAAPRRQGAARVAVACPRHLDARRDADELLHEALGHKKLKELRRQRNRLAGHGGVDFSIARTPGDVAAAIETFLKLEASGWKGKRGTALVQDGGDATFIRRATSALAPAASARS